jgi:hypothetical protein
LELVEAVRPDQRTTLEGMYRTAARAPRAKQESNATVVRRVSNATKAPRLLRRPRSGVRAKRADVRPVRRVTRKHGFSRCFLAARAVEAVRDDGASGARGPCDRVSGIVAGVVIAPGESTVGTGLRRTTRSIGRSGLKKVNPEIR